MGFKANYNSEAALLLSIMIIFSLQMSANAYATPTEPEPLVHEYLQAPLPEVHVPVPEVPAKPQLNTDELDCLAEAVYFESKNESHRGQRAVAHVIVNRTKNDRFPSTVCGVVNQKHKRTCQFSYKCDGKPDVPKNKEDYETAKEIAENVLDGEKDTTAGALFFHNNTVRPAWAKPSRLTAVIGNHKFYRG